MTDSHSILSSQFVNNLPGAAYRCRNDAVWTMLEVSDGIEKLCGYTAEEFLSGSVQLVNIIHPDDAPESWGDSGEQAAETGKFEAEYRLVHKDGSIKHVWDYGEAIYMDGELIEIIGFISDLTPKAKQQTKIDRGQKAMLQLASSPNLVSGKLTSFSKELTQKAADILAIDRVSVWFFNDDKTQLKLSSLYEKNNRAFTTEMTLHKADFPIYFQAVIDNRILDILDIANDERTQEFLNSYSTTTGVKSMLDIGIRLSGKVIGVICHEVIGKSHRWTIEDIALATEYADLLAQLFANKQRIAIENQIRETQAASKAKSQLLAMISHEIRTPMNGVLGMVELLSATKLDEQQTRYVETIKDSGDLLLTIINDVLDYSKLDAGKLKLLESNTNIPILIQGIVDLLTPVAKPTVNIRVNKQAQMHEILLLDHHRLRQILINIIGNSLKFTEQGHVSIDYGLADKDLWFIEISDTGPGVEKDQLDKLFLPFEQVIQSANSPQDGTGLGLSICKDLVTLMGGTINANSAPGKGANIRVELPLQLPKQAASTATSVNPQQTSQDFSKLNVLVAEDNAVNRMVIEGLLKSHGITPTVCINGQEAVELCTTGSSSYDLILMDCDMPVMDGFTASKLIRAKSQQQPKPAIAALTAHALDEFREKAASSGMDHYLTKPIRSADLKQLLQHICT